jgi:hypothetical protein
MQQRVQLLTSIRHFIRTGKTPAPAAVNPRRWCLSVLASTLILLIIIGAVVYIIDPYQVYRRPTWYKPVFIEAYSTIPGIIRHYDYDSIIVGSSMSQNFRISDIHTLLGWKSIKLTAPSCSPAHGKLFITTANKRGSLQNVLYSFDIPSLTKSAQQVQLAEYLYDDSPWNNYLYLWNQRVLCNGIPKIMKALCGRKRYVMKQDEDRMWSWDMEDGRQQYGAKIVTTTENERGRAIRGETLGSTDLAHMRENLEFNLLSLIRAHSQIRFVVFFPPYSIQAWHNIKASGNLDAYLQFRREACELLQAYPNVNIFDFQADHRIICDFENYKDGTHYSPAISRLIIERIADGDNQVEAEDIITNNLLLRQLLQAYETEGPLVP